MIYRQLILVYLKIGVLGSGGGYTILSLIQHEVIDHYQWLTLQQSTDVVTISQMISGSIGINSATYVGYPVTQGVWDAIAAITAVCLPSSVLVLLIFYFFVKRKDNRYIKAAMSGLLPMSVSSTAAAALLLMSEESFIDYRNNLISAVASGVAWKWNIHPVLLITSSGIAEYALY